MKVFTPYKDDSRLSLLEDDDGKRYVMVADLMHERDGFTQYTTTYCQCCRSPKSQSFGPVARIVEDMVELGWAMTEEAYLEWKRGGER